VTKGAVGAEGAAYANRHHDDGAEHKPIRHGTRFPKTGPSEIYRWTATSKMTVGDDCGICVCLLS
jgi:hypothetical protein